MWIESDNTYLINLDRWDCVSFDHQPTGGITHVEACRLGNDDSAIIAICETIKEATRIKKNILAMLAHGVLAADNSQLRADPWKPPSHLARYGLT